ncbi:MAG: 50S ribosomal protein L10 [Terriglobales bacterium]
MSLTKADKQNRVEELHGEFQGTAALIVNTFDHLTVAQDFQLRQQLRAVGARYRVLKNSLAERAAVGTPMSGVLKELKGVTSIAYTSGDAVALAKVLQKYTKDNPTFVVKAGLLTEAGREGRALTAAEVDQLAALPSKEELYAKLLYLLQAPAQRLVTVLSAAGRNTAVVIDQAVKANKFSS